jgi:asparagine synthase (glutamine-hydrolysing)
MSMAQSLEVRVPFVDQRMIEVVSRIPLRHKLAGGVTKGLFREAMSPFLPEEIIKAPKQGLNLPISLWFRNDLRDWMKSVLSAERLEARGYLRPEGVKGIIDEHISGKYDHSLFLWALIVLEVWHQEYIDKDCLARNGEKAAAGDRW